MGAAAPLTLRQAAPAEPLEPAAETVAAPTLVPQEMEEQEDTRALRWARVALPMPKVVREERQMGLDTLLGTAGMQRQMGAIVPQPTRGHKGQQPAERLPAPRESRSTFHEPHTLDRDADVQHHSNGSDARMVSLRSFSKWNQSACNGARCTQSCSPRFVGGLTVRLLSLEGFPVGTSIGLLKAAVRWDLVAPFKLVEGRISPANATARSPNQAPSIP